MIETETASLDIPSDMLSNVTAETEQVSIRVSAVSPDNLDDAVREQTGDRPVIGLRLLTASGEELGWNNPDAPVTVSIPYTPTEEELQNPDHIVVWYIDGEGNVTAILNGRFNEKTGSVVFSTTHFSTFAVASVFKTFDDLQHVSWAKEAIEVLAARDVIRGNGENRFMPSKFITRADYIALLVRVLELQSAGEQVVMFADVADSAYYVDELRIAKELGILPDTGSNLFQPSNDISREEMMVLTVRALTAAGMLIDDGEALDAYLDAASVSDYARESVEALVASKLIVGKGGKLAPSDPLTRAEAAMVLYRIWKR